MPIIFRDKKAKNSLQRLSDKTGIQTPANLNAIGETILYGTRSRLPLSWRLRSSLEKKVVTIGEITTLTIAPREEQGKKNPAKYGFFHERGWCLPSGKFKKKEFLRPSVAAIEGTIRTEIVRDLGK